MESLNTNKYQFNTFQIKESQIPIEALYNFYVDKIKAKEKELNWRSREFHFKYVDENDKNYIK